VVSWRLLLKETLSFASNVAIDLFTLRDCLHAPGAPINLLSVGTMQEQRMCVHFNEDVTIIHFPSDHPTLAGLSFTATVVHRLSFLHCDFISPDLPVSDGTEVVFPTFPVVEKTPTLWHHRFGHLSIDATRALLMKDYATGIDWSGSLALSEHCISCLIGKHPQIPYSHHGHHAMAVCELLHMDSCGPFPVLTPHKKHSFWAILDDKSNFGHVELLSAKSDVYSAYVKVESLWEAKSGNRVVTVHMDGAKEFSQGKLGDHLSSHGIVMQHQENDTLSDLSDLSCARHLRRNQTDLMDLAKAMYLSVQGTNA